MSAAFFTPRFDLVLGLLGEHQRERHVVAHGHVRIQRVVLEHHRDVAFLRRNAIDDPAADADLAMGDFLESGQHAQQRRLAATRRTDEHAEFAVGDVDVDTTNDLRRAEILLHRSDADCRHAPPSMSRSSAAADRALRPLQARVAGCPRRRHNPVAPSSPMSRYSAPPCAAIRSADCSLKKAACGVRMTLGWPSSRRSSARARPEARPDRRRQVFHYRVR